MICPKCDSINTDYIGCVFYTYSRECRDCGNVFPDPTLNVWGQHIKIGEDRNIWKETTKEGFQKSEEIKKIELYNETFLKKLEWRKEKR